jgi:hypothetical protein
LLSLANKVEFVFCLSVVQKQKAFIDLVKSVTTAVGLLCKPLTKQGECVPFLTPLAVTSHASRPKFWRVWSRTPSLCNPRWRREKKRKLLADFNYVMSFTPIVTVDFKVFGEVQGNVACLTTLQCTG